MSNLTMNQFSEEEKEKNKKSAGLQNTLLGHLIQSMKKFAPGSLAKPKETYF